MFAFGQGPKTYNIVTTPSLPFDRNEKYAKIYDYVRIRLDTLNQAVGETYIYQPVNGPKKMKEKSML